jgi:hypothetical protein
MEYLEDNLDEWLDEELSGYGDDDYLVFDCPGQVAARAERRRGLHAQGQAVCARQPAALQHSHSHTHTHTATHTHSAACSVVVAHTQIELFSHVGAIRSLVDRLRADGWSVAAVFCMDVAFVNEPTKFIAGCMQVRVRVWLCVYVFVCWLVDADSLVLPLVCVGVLHVCVPHPCHLWRRMLEARTPRPRHAPRRWRPWSSWSCRTSTCSQRWTSRQTRPPLRSSSSPISRACSTGARARARWRSCAARRLTPSTTHAQR